MTVNAVRQELPGQPAIGRTTIHGGPAVLFSLPFTAVGILITLLSLNVIPTPDSKFHAPRPLVASFGWLFFSRRGNGGHPENTRTDHRPSGHDDHVAVH